MRAAVPPGNETFDSTLDAARAGATWAWLDLLEDIEPRLRGYMLRHGAQDAEDLIAETWLHVARGIHDFEGDRAAFRSWVFVIGHHRIIDERRRRRRKPADAAEVPILEAVAPASPSAEDQAVDELAADEVQRLLDHVSPAQREVLLLRFLGDFGITEISEIVGKRPGAVQALQHRAFQRLRKLLGDDAPDPGARR